VVCCSWQRLLWQLMRPARLLLLSKGLTMNALISDSIASTEYVEIVCLPQAYPLILNICCLFAVAAADLCGRLGLCWWLSISRHDQVQQESHNGTDTEPCSRTSRTAVVKRIMHCP
jgi:hypothetical protein